VVLPGGLTECRGECVLKTFRDVDTEPTDGLSSTRCSDACATEHLAGTRRRETGGSIPPCVRVRAGNRLRRDGRTSPRIATDASASEQHPRGLKYLNREGLVHRDVAPDNILVPDDGIASP